MFVILVCVYVFNFVSCVLDVVCTWGVSCLLNVMFVCVEDDVCKTVVCSVYVWWRLKVREGSLGVCSELCLVCFPIVCECVSVLLYFLFLVRVLIVVIMGRWSAVVCGTLVGMSVFSMLCSELLIMSEIS